MTQIASGRATGDGSNEKQITRPITEEQAMDHVRGLLQYIGEDLQRDGLRAATTDLLTPREDVYPIADWETRERLGVDSWEGCEPDG